MAAHNLVETEYGQRCTICGQSWKQLPQRECPGVLVYGWGKWPENLLTKKQMGDAGFQTGKKLPPAAGVVWRDKSPDGKMWLYDRTQGVPKNPISEAARAKLKVAAEKSRQGWYCVKCGQPTGWVSSKGYFIAQYHNPPGMCMHCSDRESVQDWARELLAGAFVILDTETTGLSAGYHEIVQIAVINQAGDVLLDSYVNVQHPERLTERGDNGVSASDISGITPEMLADAPAWPEVYARLMEAVAGQRVVIYNAAFDEAMIAGDCTRHGILPHPNTFEADCAMIAYAQYCGEWSRYHGDYRWQPLDGGHTALEDCQAVLSLLRQMAEG